jgi:hypothetical protein
MRQKEKNKYERALIICNEKQLMGGGTCSEHGKQEAKTTTLFSVVGFGCIPYPPPFLFLLN